ncbi:alpha-2-macroglobulin family protein [Hymenobacter actinosclerus]|uniref:Alpha-2-macroglobulin family protein n=1 Tax=Hymenobacter actinosclerus TaxID=82805 RepID=A0A1I0H1S0_9BACT|nr:MG2 domain-containing protein [Hymenobacter actinosclerus]SET77500.1 Alpha-2-macroglobulin family protein [Hymenobacter actinosclerus]
MRPFLLSLLALLMLLTPGSSQTNPADRPDAGPNPAVWLKIDQLLAKGQTASAARLLEPLYQQARRRPQAAPEYVRTLLYKLRLLENKEEEADVKGIELLEKDLKTAQFPARPVLHSLLAQLYARYYDQHRYQLYDRTNAARPDTADASRADLQTWDAAQLAAAIVGHYQASVTDEPRRQQQTLLSNLGYLSRGADAAGRARRPTLFDLLAFRAVEGLGNDELYLTKPAQQFRLIDPKLFGPAAEFARLPLQAPAPDSLNGQFHALQVVQQLLAFRLQSATTAPEALADADLQRLEFVQQHAELANKTELYRAALRRAADTYRASPIAAEFGAAEAASWQEEDPGKAHALALDVEKAYAKSRGASQAAVLRGQLERVEIGFTTEDVLLPGRPWLLKLTVRNAPRLYATAYRLSSAQVLRQLEQPVQYQDKTLQQRYARALAAKPAAAWTLEQAGPTDFRSHTVQQAGPALPLGQYLIVLSTAPANPTKEQPGTVTTYNQVQVSELSYLRRNAANTNGPELLVLHRQTGAPLAGVRVVASAQKYNQFDNIRRATNYVRQEPQNTDEKGKVSPIVGKLPGDVTQIRSLLFSKGADSLLINDYLYHLSHPRDESAERAQRQTFLYTDRAIYRPGQTLYFKGILTETLAGKSTLLTNTPVSVRLIDVNGQTVQTLPFTTNDFGSFHSSLVLPTGLLNGQMQLQTDHGSVDFAVEDYKRPTFQVTMAPVQGTPVLGQEVTVRGTATAYAGQPVDGAAVSYRVVRRTFWPYFGRGYYGGGGPAEQEIASGTARTDSAGSFAVTFVAQPGETGSGGKRGPGGPGYVFEVTADVTDAAGETRTGQQRVSLGTAALVLRLQLPALLNRAALAGTADKAEKTEETGLQLLSTNAAGEALPATGELRLYRLTPPATAFRPRLWERPEREALSPEEFGRQFPLDAYGQQDNDSTWARTLVATLPFNTEKAPALPELAAQLARQEPGRYLLEASATPAKAGQPTAKTGQFFTLFDPAATRLPVPTTDWFVPLQSSVTPGGVARFLVGSSLPDARVLLAAEANGQPLRPAEWLTLRAGEQRVVEVPVPAAPGEGQLYVHLTQVRDNRLYTHTAPVQIAPPPAPLLLDIATFRDKLQPGQPETWRVTIKQTGGKPADAELLATLYDQSLDVFRPHDFQPLNFPQRYFQPMLAWQGSFGTEDGRYLLTDHPGTISILPVLYPELNLWGFGSGDGMEAVETVIETKAYVVADAATMRPGAPARVMIRGARAAAAPVAMANSQLSEVVVAGSMTRQTQMQRVGTIPPPADLSQVQARTDFRETAFWLPALRTNAQGETVLEFQMPEAVTRWQLLALAHDRQLRTGQLRRELVTQKKLQVTANAPRFFREGDQLIFQAKLSNLTNEALAGTAQLLLLDARTQQPLEARLLQSPAQLAFNLPANQSQALSWSIMLPENIEGQLPLEAVTYKVVASAQLPVASSRLSGKQKRQRRKNGPTTNNQQLATIEDGEQNTLPVLPNRLLVTESLPLPIVGPATREFELKKLTSTTSATRRNYSLTLEMTPNPAWYAVQALPYLMEYPYECSEQVFSRLYANLLAAKILQSSPALKTTLAEWQRAARAGDPAALSSKLEQNPELKSLLLQETPWVRDAQNETERMRRLTELFDEPRLKAETARALAKLRQQQLPDGAFPWFEKMPADRYITQLIVAGFGKLQKLGAFDALNDEQARPLLQSALAYLDGELQQDYARLRKQPKVDLKADNLNDLQIQALYARSFWPAPAVPKAAQPAQAYYRQQAATYWSGRTRYLQAQTALALHRAKIQPTVTAQIMTALSENALHSDELGMYWKDVRPGYYWREAPTETQATLIEAYDEIKNDQRAVDELKLWLLKQKQVQSWASTRATADACYALLLRGSDWLKPAAEPLVVTVGGQPAQPTGQQAVTGYYKITWPATEIKPAQGRVTVRKPDAGVAWGALYWQYFEQLDKITPAATGLQLERRLYREQRTAAGPVLEPLRPASPLRVGDVLVVRLVLRADRDLEYVHLKDQRAAGLELIGQTSGYRYQSGLGYYESPRDAATNFFISYFPKGTHTFEYRLRAAQAGNFSGGLSQLQCLYAPEFTTHSVGTRVSIAGQK